MSQNGSVNIFYNPKRVGGNHKFHTPQDYKKYSTLSKFRAYMLVNDVYDLQGMSAHLAGSFALSQDIDASTTQTWNHGAGFNPIGHLNHPFSGTLKGNGYTIKSLLMKRPQEDYVGLFGYSSGSVFNKNKLDRLHLKDFNIVGRNYVGALMGSGIHIHIKNISISGSITGELFVGGLLGSIWGIESDSLIEMSGSPHVQGFKSNISNGQQLQSGTFIGFCGGRSCLCDAPNNMGTCYSEQEITSGPQLLDKIHTDHVTNWSDLWEKYKVCKEGQAVVLFQDSKISCIDTQ